MGEVRHPQLGADALDDAEERVLLDPHLRAITLPGPQVLTIGLRGRADDACRIGPERMYVDLAGAILDRIPVDQATVTGIADDAAEPLILPKYIFELGAGDELIEQLAQRQAEAESEIFVDDGVCLPDCAERGRMRLP